MTTTEITPPMAPAAERRGARESVFEEWVGGELDEILLACRDLVEDPDFPTVSRWREGGGKVLGHFQVYFPEEIAHAAGMLPLKVRGAPLEPARADARFGSYLCSILKTSLELVLSGRVELDMFVTHPICDAARNLAPVWGRNYDYPCQILYLPQNANSGHSATYLRDEYSRLLGVIEGVAGARVTDEALRRSIGLFNENRALIREIYEIKRESPWLLSAEDAYCLMSVGGMIPKEEHNELLRVVLPLVRERTGANKEDRIRVVLEGGFCEQPPLDLIRMVGRSCYIVDDDLMIGLRWIIEDVPAAGDPLAQLAEAYLERSTYSPVQHDLRKPKERMLEERISAARADAAIIMAAKMCEPALEEQVCYTHALDGKGIDYFVSEFEENMTSFDHLGLQIETFTENLLFSEPAVGAGT
jgi:benzoyl-CoA reductase subunit C